MSLLIRGGKRGKQGPWYGSLVYLNHMKDNVCLQHPDARLVLNTWERLSKRLFIIFFGLITEAQLVLPAWGTWAQPSLSASLP